MSVIVEVPGHGEVEFPDGMSDEEMETAIRRNFMLPQKKTAPKMEPTLLNRMGKIGQAGVKGLITGGPLGGIVGASGEASQQSAEMFDRAAYDAGGSVTDALAGKVSPEVAAGLGYATNVVTQA